jgi:hypothetical protein
VEYTASIFRVEVRGKRTLPASIGTRTWKMVSQITTGGYTWGNKYDILKNSKIERLF